MTNTIERFDRLAEEETATFTVPETARLLGRSEELVRRWLREGVIHGHRANRSWAIPLLAIADASPKLALKSRRGTTRTKQEMQRAHARIARSTRGT